MDRKSKLNVAFNEAEDHKYLVSLYRTALKVDFALTPDDHRSLEHFYRPLVIKAGTNRPTDHPIAAAHQRIAQKFAYDFAKNHQNIIEIGPNASNFYNIALGNPLAHGCTKFSARDQSRHWTSASSSKLRGLRPSREQIANVEATGLDAKLYLDRVNALATGIPSHTFCVDGFEFCGFQSKVAIAVHSLYDLTLGQLALGMEEHGIHQIKAWMHIPVQALETKTWTDYDNMYRFKTTGKGDKSILHFNFLGDTSFGYEHNRADWLSYLTTGALDTPFGFGIAIEKVRHNGSQFELNITRVTAGGSFFYQVPNELINLCKVPNFTKLALNSFCKRQEIEYVITDASKVRKLFEFIYARKEAGFNIDTVKAYARTLVNEVRLGEKVVELHWNVTTEEFTQVCLSIYLLACFQRGQDHYIIEKALSHMLKNGDPPSWFQETWKKITTFLEKHGCCFKHHHEQDPKLSGRSQNLFTRAHVEFFKDYDCHSGTKEFDFHKEVNFAFTPPDFKPTIEDIVAINENSANELALGQIITTNAKEHQTWGLDLGVHAVLPDEIAADYLAEDQHATLIMEMENGEQKAREEEKPDLAFCLGSALPFLMKYTPKKLHTENMILLKGVPGAGKTGRIMKSVIPSVQGTVIVLCPTSELQRKYASDLEAPSRALTCHKGLGSIERFNPTLVIIEEAFTLPIAYVNAIASKYKVLLVGDPQQITHVDFSGLWSATTKLEKIIQYIPTEEMLVSKRCPVDVTALPVMRRAYPQIRSCSQVKTSIHHVHPGFRRGDAKILTICQAEKARINGPLGEGNANTVAEVQGQTFPSVILHYAGLKAERELLERSPNYLVVGLTRHTNQLFIRDETAGESNDITRFINDSAPVSFYADRSNIDLNALDALTNIKPIVAENTDESPIPYAANNTDESACAMLLHKYFPAPLLTEQQATMTTHLDHGDDMKGVLRLEQVYTDELHQASPHYVYKFVAGQRVKVTRSTDQRMLVKSMLKRLTAHTKNLPEVAAERLAKRLFDNLAAEFDWTVSTADLHTCLVQAMDKFENRGHDLSELKDIATWTERSTNMVKAFLKSQQKPCNGSDPNTKDKAGQCISAWDKTLNFQICTWTRLLELVLVKQSKGNVVITSGMTDLEVMALLEQDGFPNDRYLENDWTEFDSSQNNVGRKIFLRALTKIGCPENLRTLVAAQLSSRTIACTALSLVVNDKKDSGAPHTLIDNCLFNMAVCMDIMKDYRKLYIKGDDSLARGPDVSFDMEKLKQYASECNWKFKPASGPSGNFVSFIINKQGCAFDLPRIAGKVLTRGYLNKDDYGTYRDAIGVTFKDVGLGAGLQMAKINSFHYNGSLDNTADFDSLLSFLQSFARGEIPFTRTVKMLALTHITDGVRDLGDSHTIDKSKRKRIPIIHTETKLRPKKKLSSLVLGVLSHTFG